MDNDEQYLRDLDFPEDRWVFSGQQWYTTAEAARNIGVSTDVIRAAADRNAIPGAILHDERRIGWRLPRSGLIAFLAAQRRRTREHQQSRDAG